MMTRKLEGKWHTVPLFLNQDSVKSKKREHCAKGQLRTPTLSISLILDLMAGISSPEVLPSLSSYFHTSFLPLVLLAPLNYFCSCPNTCVTLIRKDED